MSNPVRRIAHIDMDAFYASVELLRYPELKGQPVVIGGRRADAPQIDTEGNRVFARLRDYVGRGVVTTSTYEARAFGVFSAMGVMKAAQLAPDAVLLPADFNSYRHYSHLFKAAVTDICGEFEDRGIDEIYVDLTQHPEPTETLAPRIQQAVFDVCGLTCSIGVAANKLLAKIGSELDKPNGITILNEADLEGRIWPLAVKKINGIGPKAAQKLAALGIVSIAELAQADVALLQTHFGRNYAMWLHDVSHGKDSRAVVISSEPRSVSRETTFERDMHAVRDRAELSEVFTRLCQMLAADLERKGYACRTLGIKLRYDDFRTVTRDITLPEPIADAASIRRAAGACLRRVPLDRRLRLLGVRASALDKSDPLNKSQPPIQGTLAL
jgi:DNA polymerase-4